MSIGIVVTEYEKANSSDRKNVKDHIIVNEQERTICWEYFNPDSSAGGSYITCSLDFEIFIEAVVNHLENGKLFDVPQLVSEIEEMSDQYWSDSGSYDFGYARAEYFTDYDYEGFTEENIMSIYETILFAV